MARSQTVPFSRKTLSRLAFGLLLSAVTGCTWAKSAQCTKLMDVVHRGNSLITAKRDRFDATTTQQLATELEGIAEQAKSLNLRNKILQELQTGYGENFGEMAKALNDMGQALEVGETMTVSVEGRQQLNQAKERMENATEAANRAADRTDALTQELISYCPTK
ncbi:MAG: hypothetical protein ACP5D7_07290 [Limnospira sp.]